MRRHLEGIVEELKALKKEGVRTVNVSGASIRKLKERLEQTGRVTAAGGGGVTSQPARVSPGGSERLPDLPVESARVPKRKARPAGSQSKVAGAPIPPPPVVDLPEGDKRARWEALRERVLNCPVCREHVREGCRVVFGVGSIDSELFFVGEAPGAEEEKAGEPFVGPAGKLLDRIICAMGFSRENVYIGNIMNWRPETPTMAGNRPPTPDEMAFCLPYLRAQIDTVKPRFLIALGATAVNGLLGPDPNRRMGRIRGTWNEFSGIPMMVTYHPSFLLRNTSMSVKRTVWEDMLKVMERAGYEISEKQRGYFLPKNR